MSIHNRGDGFKVVLVGETDVGKSSFFVRFRDGRFIENLSGTIGLDHTTGTIEISNEHSSNGVQETRIQLWDTAGLEKAGRLTNNHYRGSRAAILMYDVTDLSSFYSLCSWFDEAKTYTRDNTEPCLFFIVGNKIDCTSSEVEVSEETVMTFADEQKVDKRNVFRISVKTGRGFNEFLSYIGSCLSGYQQPSNPAVDKFKQYEPNKKCEC